MEPLEPGFTRIVHPGLGASSVSVVPEVSLPHWHRAGWQQVDPPPAEPEPVALADVAGTAETEEES